MAKPNNIYSEVMTVPRDEHMDYRIEVQVRDDGCDPYGVLIAGKARDGKRVLDVYVLPLRADELRRLAFQLCEAANRIIARGGE